MARGEWQIARVYAAVSRFEASRFHAQRYLHACRDHSFEAFDLAFAHEGMARALVVIDPAAASDHLVAARKAGADIKDPKDQSWLETNLEAIDSSLQDT